LPAAEAPSQRLWKEREEWKERKERKERERKERKERRERRKCRKKQKSSRGKPRMQRGLASAAAHVLWAPPGCGR
jgi:hypothetical protein